MGYASNQRDASEFPTDIRNVFFSNEIRNMAFAHSLSLSLSHLLVHSLCATFYSSCSSTDVTSSGVNSVAQFVR